MILNDHPGFGHSLRVYSPAPHRHLRVGQANLCGIDVHLPLRHLAPQTTRALVVHHTLALVFE